MPDLFADRLRIEGDGTGHGTTVYLDGEPIRGVQEVSWTAGVHGPSRLTLVLIGKPEIHVEEAPDG